MKYARIIAEVYGRAWALPEATLLVMRDLLIQRVIGGAEWSAEEIRERIDASNEKNGYAPRAREEARYLFADGTAASEWDDMPMRAASGKRNAAAPGSVAVIPIVGIVSNRMSMMGDLSGSGGASAQKITLQFRQALEDGNCKAIVFDVDSPGGSVEGVAELASEIFAARKVKPITAVFNAMGCSAAYWLASAASEVVCTPSGQCGSIGVY